MPGLNLNGNYVDLKARKDNKALRDFCAKVVDERNTLAAQCQVQHEALEKCLEVLAECRDAIPQYDEKGDPLSAGREMHQKITALIGE